MKPGKGEEGEDDVGLTKMRTFGVSENSLCLLPAWRRCFQQAGSFCPSAELMLCSCGLLIFYYSGLGRSMARSGDTGLLQMSRGEVAACPPWFVNQLQSSVQSLGSCLLADAPFHYKGLGASVPSWSLSGGHNLVLL